MRPRFLLALAVPAVLACESGLLPQPNPQIEGTFVLDVSNGPVQLRGAPVQATLLADTLHFEADGSVVRSWRMHHIYETLRESNVHWTAPYSRRTQGIRVELQYICPPNALCAPTYLRGNLIDDGLVLKASENPRRTLRYHRISR